MRLTTRARYGSRALINLALHYGKKPVFLHDVAREEGVSEKYLQHLFSSLKVAGIVKSERGAHGGFSLATHPSKVKLSKLIPVLEGPLDLVPCTSDNGSCDRASECATRNLWKSMSDAMNEVLESMTLSDLADLKGQKQDTVIHDYQI